MLFLGVSCPLTNELGSVLVIQLLFQTRFGVEVCRLINRFTILRWYACLLDALAFAMRHLLCNPLIVFVLSILSCRQLDLLGIDNHLILIICFERDQLFDISMIMREYMVILRALGRVCPLR